MSEASGAAQPSAAAASAPAAESVWRFIARGFRKRCPRCGSGPLFVRGARMHERCAACDLRYLENRGDPWVFLLLLDRAAFIFPLVVALYFGLHRISLPLFLVGGVILGLAFLKTAPRRYGISVALVYWVRWRAQRRDAAA